MIDNTNQNNVLAFRRKKFFDIVSYALYFYHLIVTLTTGGSSSLNNSYIQVTSDTKLSTGSTQYTICPCSDDICRIKFDFEVRLNLCWL